MKRKLFNAFYRKEDWAVKEVYEQYCRLLKHVSYPIVGDNDLADGIVNAAVYVVGVEYHSGGILGGFFLGEGAEAQKHRRRQQDGQQFFGHG